MSMPKKIRQDEVIFLISRLRILAKDAITICRQIPILPDAKDDCWRIAALAYAHGLYVEAENLDDTFDYEVWDRPDPNLPLPFDESTIDVQFEPPETKVD